MEISVYVMTSARVGVHARALMQLFGEELLWCTLLRMRTCIRVERDVIVSPRDVQVSGWH